MVVIYVFRDQLIANIVDHSLFCRDGAFGETVFCHKDTKTLIVTDTVLEVTEEVPKPKRVSLLPGMEMDDVTLETALSLLGLPRSIGNHPEDGEEIVEGSLTCQTCKEVFPIQDTIPNLLPTSLRS